ncbi:MAG: alkaline phosphatase [Natronospirillum sp.]|uniref:alkaline phosphatase n=1 Tax=Natronospirillum sp. TaxID=2812955 RepID=UPI0025D7255B|nr:alkaline phosphatase [Natronospirillum sp.]MCH8551825.1 alkaline phosphatase [Natronospirillum sp.]
MRQILITLFVLNLLFVALAWPLRESAGLPLVAAEALLLTGLFLLLPSARFRAIPARGIALLYVLAALFVGFDVLVQTSLGRSLNVYLDLPLLRSAYDLSMTNLGGLSTALIAVGGLALAGVVIWLLESLLTRLPATGQRTRLTGAGLLLAGLGAGLAAPMTGGLVAAQGIAVLGNQWQQAQDTRLARQAFAENITREAEQHEPSAMPGLADRDVYLVFVESYGMEAITDERYSNVIEDRLNSMEQQLDEVGMAALTGRLKAPIQGGQSWLAHATLLSGQWIPNQLKYETLLDSGAPTLVGDFSRIGHAVHAVIPANTRDWPEGRQYGFDAVHDSTNMGYEGPAMNFFTMPDQYTLSWLHHTLRQQEEAPLFAMAALISSHAPWVPVIPIVDWNEIDDGAVFDEHADGHPSPDEVFQDNERVRRFYLDSVEYSLQVVADFAERYLPEDALLIAIGDHEAPPVVTRPEVNRAVPIHLISGDETLLSAWEEIADDAFAATLREGMWPGREQTPEAPGMDAFRAALHRAYD